MNEEDFIKKLFEETTVNYSTEGIEQAVLKKIEIKSVYRKRQQRYARLGKIGFSILLILSFCFTLSIGKDDTFYLLVGMPFVLLLLMFPLERVLKSTTFKTPLYNF